MFSKASIQSNNVTFKDFVGRLQVWYERITSKKVRQIFVCISGLFYLDDLDFVSTAKRKLERLQFSTSSSFVKI